MFLDDDDWIAEDHVQNLVAYLENHPEVQAAYSSTQKTSFDGTILKEVFSQDFSHQLLMHDNYIPIHSMLFSSSLLAQNCRFDNRFDIFEDWDFWLQLSQHTDFAHVDNLTAFYREGGESETASTSAEATERFSEEGIIAAGRARLFSKWLKIWDGSAFNSLIGSLDKSGDIHKLNEALDARGQTITWQQQKIDERENAVSVLNAEVAAKASSLESLNSELATAYTTLHETNTTLHETNTTLQETNTTLQETNLRNEALMAEIQSTEQKIQHLSQELANVTETAQAQSLHIKQLEHSIHAIWNSTSWRLMGPFRRVVRILRSLLSSKQAATTFSTNELDENRVSNQADLFTGEGGHAKPIFYAIDTAAYANGYLYLRGWACGSPAIESIELIHGGSKTAISMGGERADIAKAFPLISSAINSGFSFFAGIDQADTYLLRVSDADGIRKEISVKPSTELSLSEISTSGELHVFDAIDQYTIYRLLNKKSEELTERTKRFDYEPLISIIVPVYNVNKQWLDACIESVINQSYPKWELCLHDDSSTKQETLDCLKAWSESDSRIKVQYGAENQHISGASNSALELADGEFIGLMDNDDELAPDALYWVVDAINANPSADYLYTDEDKID